MNTARTSLFYMANLGSEVSRALLEYQKKDFMNRHDTIFRAKKIIEKIKEFSEMKGRTGDTTGPGAHAAVHPGKIRQGPGAYF